MGCTFCATGRLGLRRNLETWEIVEQIRTVRLKMLDDQVKGRVVRWRPLSSLWRPPCPVGALRPGALSDSPPSRVGLTLAQHGVVFQGCAHNSLGALSLPRLFSGDLRARLLSAHPTPLPLLRLRMGEPLANTDNVIAAVNVLSDPAGSQIHQGNITVSTSGLPVGIRRLAREVPKVRLVCANKSRQPAAAFPLSHSLRAHQGRT